MCAEAQRDGAETMTPAYWFRELLARGKGPDWVFNATFAPDSSSVLSASVRHHAPVGFTDYQATQRPCPIHGQRCDYILYVDTPHYQSCIAQLEGHYEGNMYVYHTIQACQDDYQIVRGYGGDPEQHGNAETRAIRALAHTPGLVMTEWSIVYGGVTYPYETLISGATSTALLAYLDA